MGSNPAKRAISSHKIRPSDQTEGLILSTLFAESFDSAAMANNQTRHAAGTSPVGG